MIDYSKHIICDFDDTLCFSEGTNIANGTPNLELIEKLNDMQTQGYTVDIFTARGHISAPSREKADEIYRPVITAWCKKHNLNFRNLSFQKPLGYFYIDDKAFRPDEFINTRIEKLTGGLSGATITRHEDRVYKNHPNSSSSAEWYKLAKNLIYVPEVHSLVGDTICMEFIEQEYDPKIDDIANIIETMKLVIEEGPDFNTYTDRIKDHLDVYTPKYAEGLIARLNIPDVIKYANSEKSFCHGDFTLDNMICNANRTYLIDPNYNKDLYSSWLLDASKILQSCRRFDNMFMYNAIINKITNHGKDDNLVYILVLLELTHWVRMRKYTDDKKFVDDNIAHLLGAINNAEKDI